MSRTIVRNTKNECLGYFGDTIKELDYLVDFMKDKKEVSRTRERKENTIYITIIIE